MLNKSFLYEHLVPVVNPAIWRIKDGAGPVAEGPETPSPEEEDDDEDVEDVAEEEGEADDHLQEDDQQQVHGLLQVPGLLAGGCHGGVHLKGRRHLAR